MKDIFAWVFELLGSATFWSAVSAMATIVAVVGIFLAARQLRFNAWLKAQEIFTESGFVTARSTIFKLLNDSNAAWGEKELADGMQICRKMDELARLASFFGMTESLGRRRMLNVWDDPIAKAWFLLKPKVQAERDKVGWQTKWKAFDTLGEMALDKLRREGRAPWINVKTVAGQPHTK